MTGDISIELKGFQGSVNKQILVKTEHIEPDSSLMAVCRNGFKDFSIGRQCPPRRALLRSFSHTYSAIAIFEAHDVVFAQIFAALHF